jgi:NAD(P)-dependent dehydrogenase (short-subunit alcohol dehydrogenase family)
VPGTRIAGDREEVVSSATMKILVIGHTGTIGAAVARALGRSHQVIGASRSGDPRIDIDDPASIRSALGTIADLDAVVCCAGGARFRPLAELADDDLDASIRSKLLGQVNVIRAALDRVRDGGSVTVTTGILSQHPMPGSAAISLVNAGLEGFVRAAALEAPRGLRVNAVSPPWVRETLLAMGMDPGPGKPADDVARAYVTAVESDRTGETLAA